MALGAVVFEAAWTAIGGLFYWLITDLLARSLTRKKRKPTGPPDSSVAL